MNKTFTKPRKTLLKKLLSTLLISSAVIAAQAQCPTYRIDLNSQAAVDEFAINYPGCTVIEAGIRIEGDDITNLYGLNSLTVINNQLSVWDSPNLHHLYGLENINYIGILDIFTTKGLKTLNGLENVDSIGNNFFINYNDSLSDISALQNANIMNMEPVWGSGGIFIHDNPSLEICHYANFCEFISEIGNANIFNNSGSCLNESSVVLACAGPLSISLIDFHAAIQDQFVSIRWKVEHESEIELYQIEKSLDGNSWSILTSKKPENSNQNAYSEYDLSPEKGINFYRLKMINIDGTFFYSDVKTVDFSSNLYTSVYPNPVENILNISANGEKVSITNMLGVEVFYGDNIKQIDVSSWAPGMYYIKVSTGEVVKVIKE